MKFTKTYKVRSSEINPQYLLKEHFIGMYFQECFAEYATSLKLAAFDVAREGRTWLTSATTVEFCGQRPFWREEVEISVWVCKATAVRLFTGFLARANSQDIAKGCGVQLIADAQTHKPLPLADVAERFGVDDPSPISLDSLTKIDMFDNGCCADIGTTQISRAVCFDELDFNMHLNNVRYIPYALESVPFEYRMNHKLAKYRVKYEREARLGDVITSRCTQRGNRFTHVLLRESDNAELGVMESVWASGYC